MSKENADNEANGGAVSGSSPSTGSEFPANYEPTVGDSFSRDGHECTIVDFDSGIWRVEGTTNFGASRSHRYTTEELIDLCRATVENGGKFFPQNVETRQPACGLSRPVDF